MFTCCQGIRIHLTFLLLLSHRSESHPLKIHRGESWHPWLTLDCCGLFLSLDDRSLQMISFPFRNFGDTWYMIRVCMEIKQPKLAPLSCLLNCKWWKNIMVQSFCAQRRVESVQWDFFFLTGGDQILTWCARTESKVVFQLITQRQTTPGCMFSPTPV